MKVIVCVDDRMGTEFNRRPLSRDRELIRDLLLLAGRDPLWADTSLAPLFPDGLPDSVRFCSDPLTKAGPGEYVFVAGHPLAAFADRIEELILYRWNRLYPSDRRLDLDPSLWRQIQDVSFPGSSHARISRETYKRTEE